MNKKEFEETLTKAIINDRFCQHINDHNFIDKKIIGHFIDDAFYVFKDILKKIEISTLYVLDFKYDFDYDFTHIVFTNCRFYKLSENKQLSQIGGIKNAFMFNRLNDIELIAPSEWGKDLIKDFKKMKSYFDIFNKVVLNILDRKREEISK